MAPAESPTSHLPDGKYKVVGLAMDMTGKKFIDEICAMGAYVPPNKVFAQYVMPNRDINVSATRKHGLKIFTQFGRYRVLRDTLGGKSLKTKSIYSCLTDFVAWLQELKESESYDGIILAYHDVKGDSTTPFLMEALKEFKLMDKFNELVKGYCNIVKVAEAQEDYKGKSLGLMSMVRKLEIEKVNDSSITKAKRRCGLTYTILARLLKADTEEVPAKEMLSFCDTIEDVMKNVEHTRELSAKVQSLRPIFFPYLRKSRRDRQRAIQLRRHLIDMEMDYQALEGAHKNGGVEEITKIVETTKASRRKKDAEELVKYIVDHFTESGEHAPKMDKDGKVITKEIGQGEPGAVQDDQHPDTETEEEEFEEAKEGEGDSSGCGSASDPAEK